MALSAAVLPGLAACQAPARAETVTSVAPAASVAKEARAPQVAVLAGGCFWGMEAVFSHIKGVRSVVSGFAGGSKATAHYERVSDGDTGHAESVRITYDPQVIRYDQLLQVFFSVASDPTQLNRQGPDSGTQYRNAIVPLNGEQARVARAYLDQLKAANPWKRPIVTAIEPDRDFFPAEDYHQDFALKNPDHPYIRYWDVPKVAAVKRTFPGLWKPTFTAN
ncbi:peptide-methionine (S)-S-oxide reductase MsrA [Novosphingobium sp.]|uniref:peptide-methionine (S)-S-oxide reductase MsrA n=1 Tax=Novosphingobium sp. TaxID=1874826 RepID=UPI0038BCC04C